MKRNWGNQQPTSYNGQASDDAVWVHMPSHPYASAYSSMHNPFTPLPPQGHDMGGYSGQIEKKPKLSDTGEGSSRDRDGESDDDDDDEEDDDDDGDDGIAGAGKGPPGKAKGKAGKGDGKQRVKLTRGSR